MLGKRMTRPKIDENSETIRIQVVTTQAWVDRLEEWRRLQPKIPSKSEAIRTLVDMALDAMERRT